MKTERELFEELQNKSVLKQLAFIESLNMYLTRDEYSDDDLTIQYCLEINHGWKMWCASASREGYKLVPVEMHWHKADDLASIEWDKNKSLFCSDNRDMTALQVEEFRLRWCKNKAHQIMNDYKAMIGESE